MFEYIETGPDAFERAFASMDIDTGCPLLIPGIFRRVAITAFRFSPLHSASYLRLLHA